MSEGRSILKFKAHLDLATLTLYSPLYLLVVFGLFFIQGGFSLLVGYLLLLTIASFRAERSTEIQSTIPSLRFALLVPAYNEERLLPGLLNSLRRLDYPDDLYEIHVVADNCTDQTALMAERHGGCAHVREDISNRGKGPALQWLFERVQSTGKPFDAVVILDADSVVNPEFLKVMATHLQRGERVIQAYYAVRNSVGSWSSSLRSAAFAVLHYLRPLGRMALGGSVGLKGNGMVFASEVFNRYRWSASITEDIELHMRLILDGERVTFAPDAVVLGEMPDSLADSESQHDRWERGRIQMLRRYVPELAQKSCAELTTGKLKRAYLFFDALMEHLIPPFALLFGLNVGFLMLNLVVFLIGWQSGAVPAASTTAWLVSLNLLLSVFLLLGQTFYVITGLKLTHASREIYMGLLYSPAYMAWKFVQYGRILLKRDQLEWVRTRRNGG